MIYRQSKKRVSFCIVDFYCPEKKLAVELDGEIHKYQKEYDRQRDLVLNELDITVLRINNNELEHVEAVKRKIASCLI